MRDLIGFVTAFLGGLAGVLLVMLLAALFSPHAFKPFVALGIATGIGLAGALRARMALSTGTFALAVGVLAMLGSTVGGWISS